MAQTTILERPALDETIDLADEFYLDIRITIADAKPINPSLSGSDCSICVSCENSCDGGCCNPAPSQGPDSGVGLATCYTCQGCGDTSQIC